MTRLSYCRECNVAIPQQHLWQKCNYQEGARIQVIFPLRNLLLLFAQAFVPYQDQCETMGNSLGEMEGS